MHTTRLHWFFIILTVLIVSIFFIHYQPISTYNEKASESAKEITQAQKYKEGSFRYLKTRLPVLLPQMGIDSSITLIEDFFSKELITLSECHVLLHTAGHEAYQLYPEQFEFLASKKSNVCVASFQHGIEAQIATSDPDIIVVVKNLKKYCSALQNILPGISCYHGVGHGVMRSLLSPHQALKYCDALNGEPKQSLLDCYRGVFSELGNLALSYDGDTGERIVGEPLVSVDLNRPFVECTLLKDQYRDSCYSQLSKIIFNNSDVEHSLERCTQEITETSGQQTCFRIVSALYGETNLFNKERLGTPQYVLGATKPFRHSYIDGVKLPFSTFHDSNVIKDWKYTCDSFNEQDDKTYCESQFQFFKQ